MSPINGLELLPQSVEKYPGIPIIVLSALTEVETVVNCMKYGAFDYLVKPFELSRLLKAIRDSMDFITLEAPRTHKENFLETLCPLWQK